MKHESIYLIIIVAHFLICLQVHFYSFVQRLRICGHVDVAKVCTYVTPHAARFTGQVTRTRGHRPVQGET